MKAWSFPLLMAVVAASLAPSAHAQQNPGLSVQPAGRSLAAPEQMPAEQPVDLTRLERTASENFDPAAVEEAFFAPAMRGEAWAQTKLGQIYIQTPDDPERQKKGMELLQRAAAQKDAEAIYLLAGIAAAGVVDQPSNIAALEKIKEAAALGNAEAQYDLASIYAEGRGVHKDMKQALIWGRKAAEQGYAPAQFSLGRALIESGSPEQKAEATDFLQLAVDAGNVQAVLFWATAVGNGQYGLPKDEARAEALLKPWAEKGNADCQFVLAALYKFGDSFTDRRNEAYVWMKRAAAQGHTQAIGILESERPK